MRTDFDKHSLNTSRCHARIDLVATDLDGTLIGAADTPDGLISFGQRLRELRASHNTRWVIITGRQLAAANDVLDQFASLGLFPDFLVTEDARVHDYGKAGIPMPHRRWNGALTFRRTMARLRSRRQLQECGRALLTRFPDAQDKARNGIDVWFHFADEASAQDAEMLLSNGMSPPDSFFVLRWGQELCLAPKTGTKGEALNYLCRRLGIHSSGVFVIGDGPNDRSMLQREVAGMTACVGNATDEILDTVRTIGGYVARGNGMAGVLEALRVYSGTS